MARQNSLACFLLLLFAASSLEAGVAVIPLAERVRLTQNLNDSFQIAEVELFETGTGTNVALQGNGGVASALNTAFSTSPSWANDGTTNGAFGASSTWHSATTLGTWWEVSLAAPAQLDTFTFWGRTDGCCQGRQNDFTLEIFDGADNLLFSQQVLGFGTAPGSSINGLAPATGIVVPEPSAFLLGGVGLAAVGLATWRRRRRR